MRAMVAAPVIRMAAVGVMMYMQAVREPADRKRRAHAPETIRVKRIARRNTRVVTNV